MLWRSASRFRLPTLERRLGLNNPPRYRNAFEGASTAVGALVFMVAAPDIYQVVLTGGICVRVCRFISIQFDAEET